MRFATLGSGSSGNAALVEHDGRGLLIDCGLSTRRVEQGCASLDFDPGALEAIVVTHEHDDHASGVARLSRKYDLPVYLSSGTKLAAEAALTGVFRLAEVLPGQGLTLGPFDLMPVIVPHDAREPCQYIVSAGQRHLGILTDVGHTTTHLEQRYGGLDALLLEFNHDAEMLNKGPYPPGLRARVAGDYGHLSNAQAEQFLQRIETGGLQWLMAAHLSEKNNTPDEVEACLDRSLGDAVPRYIAAAGEVSPWLEIT